MSSALSPASRLDRRIPGATPLPISSLKAGVPIADLSVEMGHENSVITSETYGHWSREMGNRAAALRETWASQWTEEVVDERRR
jgi:hypothetical protein